MEGLDLYRLAGNFHAPNPDELRFLVTGQTHIACKSVGTFLLYYMNFAFDDFHIICADRPGATRAS